MKRWGRAPVFLGGALIAIVLAVAICEALGWPFLVGPMQTWLSRTLDRRVMLAPDAQTKPVVRIGLIGSVRLDAAYLEIGAPAWSTAPHMLLARDARLRLAYWDLWRAYKGDPLRIRGLQAAALDGQLERTADGRASWQFGAKPPAPSASDAAPRIPSFDKLEVGQGTLIYRDAPLTMNMDAQFSLSEQGGEQGGERGGGTGAATGPASAASASNGAIPPGLQFHGKGSYLKLPIRVDVETSGALPILTETKVALPVTLDAVIGRAQMSFRGTATDVIHFGDLKGVVTLQGPSLAAVGDPLRVTLPTTGPFDFEGQIAKTGVVWNAVLNRLAIGTSRLNGAFTYDPRPGTPLLAGRLSGSKLALADLGPAVGRPVAASASAPPGVGASAKAKLDAERSAEAAAKKTAGKPANKSGKVLPDRDFDLPSLRAMNANVLIDIADLDLGTSFLEPLKPLRTHLVLTNGVLSLNDIDARTGQGTLAGSLRLDGRNSQALWDADLRWDNVRLDSWIHQSRKDGAPPYIAGLLDGRARVAGQGKSTAAILGSLKGGVRMNLVDGSVSHLAIEAAGLDVAQALGVFLKGDDSLPMRCAVADLVADQGTLTPRVLVVQTKDSVLWVDGAVSLANEGLDLRLLASPLDFSPLTLRTPVSVKGDFADPHISIEGSKLATRVGAAALLALVTPVAAIIPFFDKGSTADARQGAGRCEALMKRIETNPELSPPGTPTPVEAASAPTAAPGAKPSGVPNPWVRLPPTSSR